MKRAALFVFLFFFLCSPRKQETSTRKQIPLTGTYTVKTSKGYGKIDINHNQPILFSDTKKLTLTLHFKLSEKNQENDYLLDTGPVNEAIEIFLNDSLVGKKGNLSSPFISSNWNVNPFYIKKTLLKADNRIDFIISGTSRIIGFIKRSPVLSPIDSTKEQTIKITKDWIKKTCPRIFNEDHEILSYHPVTMQNDSLIISTSYTIKGYLNKHAITTPITTNMKPDKYPVRTEYYYSSSLDEYRPYSVYLPSSYSHEKKYPVIYCFGGASEIHQSLFHPPLPEKYEKQFKKNGNFILIGLQGSPGGNYLLEPATGKSLSKSFINEAIPFFEKKYSIDREKRFLLGLSKGGSTSLLLAACEKGLFQGAVSVSGVLNTKQRNIQTLMSLLKKKNNNNPDILICCGNQDELGLTDLNKQFHKTLLKNKIKHRFSLFKGGHHHNEWFQMIPDIFVFYSEIIKKERL